MAKHNRVDTEQTADCLWDGQGVKEIQTSVYKMDVSGVKHTVCGIQSGTMYLCMVIYHD